MGILNWFESCSKEEQEEANQLVFMASIAPKGLFIPLMKRYPDFLVIAQANCCEKFDYFYTCGLIFIVMLARSDKGVLVARKKALKNWNKDSFAEITRLSRLVNNNLSQHKINDVDDISTYVAGWVLHMTSVNLDNSQIKKLYDNNEYIPRHLGKVMLEQVQGFFE